MQAALKVTTRVLPGKKVEFTAPELIDGEAIELIVFKADSSESIETMGQFKTVIEFIDSLNISNDTRYKMKAITPQNYIGYIE